jgi:GT2 family glycosyltransferase
MSVGVVAIGRNEGQRLAACLASAPRDAAAVVYVDSGSTDGSVQLARSLGATVVELDLSTPFTAARARNEGASRLLAIAPATQFIQFVDGDCELETHWTHMAVMQLHLQPKTAVVCGRRRERFPNATIYNQLCDMEWDTPIGDTKSCGGDAMIRLSAFQQVGGYDPNVIAGEEPEMCVRLRAAGWVIHRLDAEMTLHDAAMTGFCQWWKRNLRAGHAYAQGFSMHGQPPENFRRREVRSITVWTLGPIIAAAAAVMAIACLAPRWCWVGLGVFGLYPVLALKVAMRRRRRDGVRKALLYGTAVAIGKIPQYLGVRKFRSAQRQGRRNAIIEYKDAAQPL